MASGSVVVTAGGGVACGEKRTRFSLSHDEGSIGNTSDNLEAISEAASNHSLASSLEECEVDQVRAYSFNLYLLRFRKKYADIFVCD